MPWRGPKGGGDSGGAWLVPGRHYRSVTAVVDNGGVVVVVDGIGVVKGARDYAGEWTDSIYPHYRWFESSAVHASTQRFNTNSFTDKTVHTHQHTHTPTSFTHARDRALLWSPAIFRPHHQPCSPCMMRLHWLPVSEHIRYNIACVCFNIITGAAPSYLPSVSLLHIAPSVRSLTVVFCLKAAPSVNPTDSDAFPIMDPSSGILFPTMLLFFCLILHPTFMLSSSHS